MAFVSDNGKHKLTGTPYKCICGRYTLPTASDGINAKEDAIYQNSWYRDFRRDYIEAHNSKIAQETLKVLNHFSLPFRIQDSLFIWEEISFPWWYCKTKGRNCRISANDLCLARHNIFNKTYFGIFLKCALFLLLFDPFRVFQ